eukprot:2547122-Pleurochrysis_carterae.AAC.1
MKDLEAETAERKALSRKKMGRPAEHAGRQALEERWDGMSKTAQRFAVLRHTHDISKHLEFAAADWEPNCFAAALQWLDLLPDLLLTRPFVKFRMDFAREILSLLNAEWN